MPTTKQPAVDEFEVQWPTPSQATQRARTQVEELGSRNVDKYKDPQKLQDDVDAFVQAGMLRETVAGPTSKPSRGPPGSSEELPPAAEEPGTQGDVLK